MKFKYLIFTVSCGTFAIIQSAISLTIGGGGNSGDISTIASWTSVTCDMDAMELVMADGFCQSTTLVGCYKYSDNGVKYRIVSCNSCKIPTTRVETNPYEYNHVGPMFATNMPTFYVCKCQCNNCENSDWTDFATGYQREILRSCDCSGNTATCTSTYAYRCATGYYGRSTNGTSGCTRCPSSGGVYGTSAAGSTAITSCYLPSGSSFSDTSGSGTYTGNCYYKN